MNLHRSTALALRLGIYAGMALILAGTVLEMCGRGEEVLWFGLLVLIVSPFAGVFVSFVALVSEKDWRWAGVAGVLLTITTIGMLIAV